jgi:hypothetical protein
MKRIFIFLLLITGLISTAQGTIPAYPGVKLTKLSEGTKEDSVLVVNGATKLVKQLPTSSIKGKTDLNKLATPTGVIVYSSTGSPAVLPLATTTNAGVQSPADKTKIDGIATGATANQSDAFLLNRANQIGTQPVSTILGLAPVATSGLKADVGLGNVDNTSDANKPISIAQQTGLDGKQNISSKGIVGGYASLDGSGKVPLSQINDVLLGSVNYQGIYNAVTNSPAIPIASSGNKGFYYVVSTAGTQQGLTLNIGDWIISNGTAWGKIDNNNSVTAVNGFIGNVNITTSNVTEGSNLYYTEARVNANTNVAANTAARHNVVTLGTANGLSLSTQALSLGLSSASATGALSSTDWNTFNNKQPAGSYEPAFSKNTGFNLNLGTTSGTIAEGNDSRILNGQTAFGWGNHAGLYPTYNGTGATGTWNVNASTATTFQTPRTINGVSFNGSSNITIPSTDSRPYKVYTALISQTGSGAPVTTTLENTLGGVVVWTYNGSGSYYATLGGAFILNKTIMFLSDGSPIGSSAAEQLHAYYISTNQIQINTRKNGTSADGLLSLATVEIRVYN